ncbi:hypothetical protein ACNFJN_07320 [Xenorhabdus budapestensis]
MLTIKQIESDKAYRLADEEVYFSLYRKQGVKFGVLDTVKMGKSKLM